MNEIKLSENIARLRSEKNITQEQLAAFIGVTKGAVSKWENASSLPDIATLPLLAAYFDVTVDELLGYAPQLATEEIGRVYKALAKDFSERPFEVVWGQVQALVQRYYACHPFLFRMCVLLLNHFQLADAALQPQVLAEMERLLAHVQAESADNELVRDASILETMVQLQLGKVEEAITTLEDAMDPLHLANNGEALLVSAYQMHGDHEKTDSFAQLQLLLALQSLLGMSGTLLRLQAAKPDRVRETVARVDAVVAAYDLVQVMPNAVGQFYYQAAAMCCALGDRQETLRLLAQFVQAMTALLAAEELQLYITDTYFDKLGSWQEKLLETSDTPRDRVTVCRDLLAHFADPFAALADDAEFRRIQTKLKAVMACTGRRCCRS